MVLLTTGIIVCAVVMISVNNTETLAEAEAVRLELADALVTAGIDGAADSLVSVSEPKLASEDADSTEGVDSVDVPGCATKIDDRAATGLGMTSIEKVEVDKPDATALVDVT